MNVRSNVVWAGLLFVAVAVATPLAADILEQVLVKVNGEIITKTELEQRQIAALRQKNPNLRPDNDAALQKALSEVTPGVIVDAVDEMLMVQRGKELGYTMSTEQFNSIVENIKKENKIETDEALQAALKQEGMTMADLRRQLERTMLVQHVQQTEIMQKLQVTETELKTYYDAHKDEFATTPQITLREITIDVPVTAQGVNVAQDDAAKAKAEEVRAKIVAGEPFARLAADYSDSGSKANGGLVGPLSAERPVGGSAEGRGRLEDRRRHAGDAHDARLSDHQDRGAADVDDQAVRRGAERDCRQDRQREAPGRVRRSSSPGCAPRRSSTGRTTRSRRRTKSA